MRSVTRVDAALLQGTAVRFIGSVTSGMDHLDRDYLHDRGIVWCNAAGSNADAVVDYCLTAMACWQLATGSDIRKLQVGIVGGGHTGAGLAGRLRQLGCPVLLCDPPLARQPDCQENYVPLQRINDCRVISLHVPLIRSGEFATENLIDLAFLQRLPANSLLINSSRGEVVDEAALLRQLTADAGSRRLLAVLDVWQHEPQVNPALVAAALLATPHIAGYSWKARTNAVERVCQQFMRFIAARQPAPAEFKPGTAELPQQIRPITSGQPWQVVLERLPLDKISARFQALVAQGMGPQGFDRLRKESLCRREFAELPVVASAVAATEVKLFRALGFAIMPCDHN